MNRISALALAGALAALAPAGAHAQLDNSLMGSDPQIGGTSGPNTDSGDTGLETTIESDPGTNAGGAGDLEVNPEIGGEVGVEGQGLDIAPDADIGGNRGIGEEPELESNAVAPAGASESQNGAAGAAGSEGYTYLDLLAAFEVGADVDLSGVSAESAVSVVALSALTEAGAATAEAFATERAANPDRVSAVRDAVASNATLVAALEAQGYASENVIAVRPGAEGTLTVFVERDT